MSGRKRDLHIARILLCTSYGAYCTSFNIRVRTRAYRVYLFMVE